MQDRRIWRHFDFVLLIDVILLAALGAAMIYSATMGTEDLTHLWRRQITYALIGLSLALLIAAIPYQWWDSARWPVFVAGLIMLIVVLFIGESEIGTVRRWIVIGSLRLQPSYVAMLSLIITLAAMLGRYEPGVPGLVPYLVSLGLAAVYTVLVFAEPDMSTAILFVMIWVVQIFASGVPLRYLFATGAAGVASLPLLWMAMSGERAYMRTRVLLFLNPDAADPGQRYNLDQAMISIGSGGIWGKGFAGGSQSQLHFLRVRHTDFIFSVISEELGFVGALLLLLLFGILLWRLLRAAIVARDLYGRLIVVGVMGMILTRAVVNIAMNLQLLPVAGLPLPFVSYGIVSLLSDMVGIGLVESVVMRHRRLEF